MYKYKTRVLNTNFNLSKIIRHKKNKIYFSEIYNKKDDSYEINNIVYVLIQIFKYKVKVYLNNYSYRI